MKNILGFFKLVTAIGIFLLLSATSKSALSQTDPEVFGIFEKYGRRTGITLLEISEELMKDYQINHFKSIIFENGTKALPEIRESIDKDKVDAKLIKESFKDGLLNSGYYRLKIDEQNLNRYLIFKVGTRNKVTLIYIEGKLTPEQLVDLLK